MTSGKAAALEEFSIEQLEEAIAHRKRTQLDVLRKRHAELVAELEKVEADLAAIGEPAAKRKPRGAPKSAAAPRGRRGPSMTSAVLKCLAGSDSKETSMSELVDQLKGRTTSDKPAVIISQALIRLKKDGFVQSAGRGVYRLTADGRKQASSEA